MNFAKSAFFLIFQIAFFCSASLGANHGNAADAKKVIFVGSYHDNHIWTQKVRDSIEKKFFEMGLNVSMRNIYLDAKNVTDKDLRTRMLQGLLSDSEKTDLIIISDLEAAEAMADIKDAHIENVPKLYASVFNSDLLKKIEAKSATIIEYDIGVEQTYLLARKLMPNAKNVYIWADKTDTGNLYMQAARDQLKKYSNSANFFFGINANSDNDFLDVAKNLPEDSFIIFLTWQKDDAGQYRNPEIFYPALAKVANSPIFTVIDNLIDGGFVGGFVLSANKNGDLIGREAANILRGHVLGGANLGFIKKGVLAAPLFNAESLWRWRMNSKNLPAGSTIIKQKKTFLETYLFGTLMTSCFVALLISIIIVELYFFIKYKKNAAKYQKLFKRNSVILRSLPIGVELYDRDGFMISANDADCQIFGIDKRKGFDKNVINIFKDPNIAEAMLKDLRRGMNVCAYLDYDFDKVKKNKYYSTTRSGIKHIECNAAPVFNSHGDIESYVLIFQDISLRYAREQNMESFRRDVNLALESDNLALWHMDAKTCEFTLLSGTGYLKTTTTLDDFTLLVEPSMRDEYRRSFEDLLYGKLTRKILDFKFTNSARIISTRSGMSAIVENGVVTGVVGINRYRVLDGEDKN